MDGRIYARPWQGGLLSGGFEKNPKPIFTEGRNQLEIQNMQEDWDHFGNGWRGGSFKWTLLEKVTVPGCRLLVDRCCSLYYLDNRWDANVAKLYFFFGWQFEKSCDRFILNVRFWSLPLWRKCQASAHTHHFKFVFSSCTETEGVVVDRADTSVDPISSQSCSTGRLLFCIMMVDSLKFT